MSKPISKKPFLNAGAAALYIIAVVTGMMYATKDAGPDGDSIIIPIAMLSLLTLSVAVMSYLFLFEPVQLLIAGEKKKAVTFFFQTIGTFAVITVIALVLAISNSV